MKGLRVICLVALFARVAGSTLAQAKRQVRIQGRDGEVEEVPTTGPCELLRNYREEIRRFVQSIIGFTRETSPTSWPSRRTGTT
jgi:hypothetical protein